METLLFLHAFATLSMVGVIWFVQIVHYPLMSAVGASEFSNYEQAHQRRTTMIVGPLMLVEAVTAALLLFVNPQVAPPMLSWGGLMLVAALWASTFLWQVPMHARLTESFDSQTHRRLVLSNWLRTCLWSARGVLAIAICLPAQT